MKSNQATNSASLRGPFNLATCATALLSLGFLSIQAFAENTAIGSITVNGNKTELKYAYTLVTTSLADKKAETILMITDKPLSAKAVSDTFVRSSETRSNNVQVLQLTLDNDKKIRSVDFSVGPLKGGANTSDYKAEVARFTPTAFAGRVTSGGAQKALTYVLIRRCLLHMRPTRLAKWPGQRHKERRWLNFCALRDQATNLRSSASCSPSRSKRLTARMLHVFSNS